MAITIPRYTGQQVANTPTPVGNVSTDASGVGAAGAVGGGLSALALAVNERESRAREVTVNGAETAGRSGIDDILAGPVDAPGTGYLYSGDDVALRTADGVDQRIKEMLDDISARLPDDAARQAFQPHRDRLYLGARERIQAHAGAATIRHEDESQKLAQDAYRRTARDLTMTGQVRYGQTPSLPPAAQGVIDDTETNGPEVVDMRALDEGLRVAELSWRAYVGRNPNRFDPQLAEVGLADIKTAYWESAIDGALTPGPNQDPKLAKMLLDKVGDQLGDRRDEVQGRVETAYVESESTAQARSIYAQHVREEGTWSERLKAAKADVPAGELNDKTDAKLEAMFREGEAVEEKEYSDQTEAILDDMDEGLTSTQAAIAAAGMPPKYRAAVAKAIDNRSTQAAQQAQNDLYQEWSFKAAGYDPSGEAIGGAESKALRQDFLDMNFVPLRPFMAREDYNSLVALQKEMREKPGKGYNALVSDTDIVEDVLRKTHPGLTGEKRATRSYEIKRQLDTLWSAEQGDGPPLTMEKKQAQADQLVAESVFDAPGVGTGNLSLLEAITADPDTLDIDDLDPAAVEVIRSTLGGNPSDAKIIRAWQINARRALYDGR